MILRRLVNCATVSTTRSVFTATRAYSTRHHLDDHSELKIVANAYSTILAHSGDDADREGLKHTPSRAAKSFAYLTKGYKQKIEDVVNGAIFHEESKDMVLVKDISFYSLCEHHLLPFFGTLNIAYMPNGKVIGLSKLARIADVFSRRLQLQERLTKEIATCVEEVLGATGVAVTMKATHLCMTVRGVQQPGATTITNCFLGSFKTDVNLTNQYFNTLKVGE